jgi:hypothetical protein
MPRISFDEVISELDHVDDPDVLERASKNIATTIALEMVRPQNWWGVGIDPLVLYGISADDGIPVAWIPGHKVLQALAAAPKGERRETLLVHEESVLQDCTRTLAECTDPWIANDVTLCKKAHEAYRALHHEAAMALCVSIGESLAEWASTPRFRSFASEEEREAWIKERKKAGKYGLAKYELGRTGLDIRRMEFNQKVLMAPIARFFTPWFPGSGAPAPEHLSRHVVAHRPTLAHFSRTNALVALMLDVSILREQQAWSDEVKSMEEEWNG